MSTTAGDMSTSSEPSTTETMGAAASQVAALQAKTREEQDFHSWESALPNPIPPAHITSLTPSGILSHLGHLNPLQEPVSAKDVLWLFDNTAYRDPESNTWQAEFVASVWEQELKCDLAEMVANIAKKVGLADDAAEKKTIEARLMPFLWDIRPGRHFHVSLDDEYTHKLGPTKSNGISSDLIPIQFVDNNDPLADIVAEVPHGTQGILGSNTFYAEPEGWGLISDIDDTIKITQTSSPSGILRKTFVDPPEAIDGMPPLYAAIKEMMGPESAFFYLSASPYNLYSFLRDFRSSFYPAGTIILRDSSWKTVSGLLSALTVGTREYKVDRMKKIHEWLPRRKMICFGDSTQSDPEAYGEIYRTFPGWVKKIFIHKVEDIAAVGIKEKNEPQRFEKAFEGVPREAWHLYTDPTECTELVRDVVSQG